MPSRLAIPLLALLLAACGGSGGGSSGDPSDPPPDEDNLEPQTRDCLADDPDCPMIAIAGDSPPTLPDGSQSPVRGYADPSMRSDPATGDLYLAYSLPYLHFFTQPPGQATSVDSHLARSQDGGQTWEFVQTLWQAEDAVDETGAGGRLDSETVSIAPRSTTTGTVWYSVRFRYFRAPGAPPRVASFHLRLASADSPELLSQAPEATLAGDETLPYWNPGIDLAALPGAQELSGCSLFDPGILFTDGRLYMAVQCSRFEPGGENVEDAFVAVFATDADGSVLDWTWEYLGKLSDYGDAQELGGETLLQTDLALGADGALLAIFSPSEPGSGLAVHFGCRVVEIQSLDPPVLARNTDGTLRVRASVTATDLAPDGPGACGYDAASSTGVVITRRDQSDGLVVDLHASGLRP